MASGAGSWHAKLHKLHEAVNKLATWTDAHEDHDGREHVVQCIAHARTSLGQANKILVAAKGVSQVEDATTLANSMTDLLQEMLRALQALDAGSDEYVVKNLNPILIFSRIDTAMGSVAKYYTLCNGVIEKFFWSSTRKKSFNDRNADISSFASHLHVILDPTMRPATTEKDVGVYATSLGGSDSGAGASAAGAGPGAAAGAGTGAAAPPPPPVVPSTTPDHMGDAIEKEASAAKSEFEKLQGILNVTQSLEESLAHKKIQDLANKVVSTKVDMEKTKCAFEFGKDVRTMVEKASSMHMDLEDLRTVINENCKLMDGMDHSIAKLDGQISMLTDEKGFTSDAAELEQLNADIETRVNQRAALQAELAKMEAATAGSRAGFAALEPTFKVLLRNTREIWHVTFPKKSPLPTRVDRWQTVMRDAMMDATVDFHAADRLAYATKNEALLQFTILTKEAKTVTKGSEREAKQLVHNTKLLVGALGRAQREARLTGSKAPVSIPKHQLKAALST